MIAVQVDARRAERFLHNLHARQLPFAKALGLNRTYNDAQDDLRAEIRRRFVLRQGRYVLRTVYRDRADMADHRAGRFSATVRLAPQSSRHPNAGLLARFVDGTPKVMGQFPIAIPTSVIRPSFAQQVPRYLYPKALGIDTSARFTTASPVGKGRRRRTTAARLVKPFLLAPPDNPRGWGIYRRTGPGLRDIEMLWALRPMSRIPRRLPFYEVMQATVARQWPIRFAEAMEFALRTARR